MKNASTHNFVIYYPISMNKKIKDMVFQALQNSHKMFFFGVIFNPFNPKTIIFLNFIFFRVIAV
jgi:threonine/homoserine/homoserine lactone efflux protein